MRNEDIRMKKIRFGIIGSGGIARKRTIPGLLMAKNAVCEAIMDLNEASLNEVGEQFGISKRYSSLEAIIADKEIDAVYIATPLFCHKEQVFAAADAGKHILLEKPMGLTAREGEEMAEYCKARGVKLGVGFMMRFHDAHARIKNMIERGEVGTVVSAYAKFNCTYPPMENNAWRQTKAYSAGGTMMDMGIHCIDLLGYLTSLKIKEAAGIYGNQIFKYPDTEDAATGVYKMDNGAIFTVEANFNLPDDLGGCKFEIYGTEGTIVSEGTLGQVEEGEVRYKTRAEIEKGWQTLSYVSGNMYTKEIELFSDSILLGTEVPVTAEDAVLNQRAVEAVYESYEKKNYINM